MGRSLVSPIPTCDIRSLDIMYVPDPEARNIPNVCVHIFFSPGTLLISNNDIYGFTANAALEKKPKVATVFSFSQESFSELVIERDRFANLANIWNCALHVSDDKIDSEKVNNESWTGILDKRERRSPCLDVEPAGVEKLFLDRNVSPAFT